MGGCAGSGRLRSPYNDIRMALDMDFFPRKGRIPGKMLGTNNRQNAQMDHTLAWSQALRAFEG